MRPDAAPGGFAPLPLPLTPLLGRERELATLVSLLRDSDSRLVTVTGAGGSGKTRLALEVGAHLSGMFSEGTFKWQLFRFIEEDQERTEALRSSHDPEATGSIQVLPVVAEYGGQIVAAVTLDGTRAIADPFEPTLGIVNLIRTWVGEVG